MKKITLLLVLALCFCLIFGGCGAQTDADDNSGATTTTAKITTTTVGFITEDEAFEIASKHWDIRPGDCDSKTGYVMSFQTLTPPSADEPIYRISLRWLVTTEEGPSHFSTLDIVLIDAVTGKILTDAQ